MNIVKPSAALTPLNNNNKHHSHLISSGRIFPVIHMRGRNHRVEVPKGKNIRTKGQFHFCVFLVELWTCVPATNLILSGKLHLNVGWGRR